MSEVNLKIEDKIDRWFEEDRKNKSTRYHMGASGIGDKCERKIWLQFRWAKDEDFPGRVLRLFERGQEEESKVVRNLERIGFKVENTEDDQYFVDLGSHVGGSLDGIITEGLSERAVLEIKTHSKKSFDDLKKHGVRISKPLHAAQMSTYCYATGINIALYYAVCKDDDRIYTELFHLDVEEAERIIERAKRIATQDEMPVPLSTNPSWYECRFCNFHGFCHGDEKIEAKSCRTCGYSTAMEDGTWFCEKHSGPIENEWQGKGCKGFEIHDHLER